MKKIVYLILSVLFITHLLSCSKKKEQLYPVQTINISTSDEVKKEDLLTTNFFKNSRLVKLETNDKSLISSISRIIIYDDKYYVLDKETNSVLVFDGSGKYISKIRHIGKGPGQYMQLGDFTIDTTKKQIVLLCNIPKSLLYYDLDLDYIKEEKISKLSKEISVGENSLFFENYLTNYNKYFLDIKAEENYNEFLSAEGWISDKIFYSPHPDIIRSKNNYFCKVYDNIVYQVTDNDVIPKYRIDFGGKFIDKTFVKENDLMAIRKHCFENNLVCRISDFREYDNYLIFRTYRYDKFIIYDKSKKQANIISHLYDPETGIYLHNYFAHDGSGNEIVFEVSSNLFINNVLNTKNKERLLQNVIYNKYLEIAKNSSINDNPIFIIYSLK